MNSRIRLPLAAAAIAVAFSFGAAWAATGPAPYTVAETGKTYGRLQDAVDAIGGGTGTIEISAGLHPDCAVQSAGNVSYLAAEPGKAVFDGVTCEGKAALVLRGSAATISGVVFQNMKVPDANGAGIRLEHGNLTIAQSWFRDSEEGILTGDDPDGLIVIDKSTFTRLGRCDRGLSCAHSIYVGNYGHLRVTRSRFEEGRGGHYVKARAAQVDVAASSFDDTHGKATNYMIDLSNGATGQISNNWFVQGQDKENYTAFIAVAAEGKEHSSDGLQIAGNDARLAPGIDRNTTFVADWSGDKLAIGENKLGPGLQRFDRR
ncbi:MAG TPA: right-handed parallel beta-helix repeat-containing protein [Sphingomonadaceae bacterium]